MRCRSRRVQSVKCDEVRCRPVAQEFAQGDLRGGLLAGTPFLIAAGMLVSRTASSLLTKDPASTTGNMVGKLENASFWTFDAPQAWLDELSKTLAGIVFTRNASHICTFLKRQWLHIELSKKYKVTGEVIVEGIRMSLFWRGRTRSTRTLRRRSGASSTAMEFLLL